MPPSDLKITSGLSLFDTQDHHAILGIPLNSDPKVVRRRYLQVARMLHPDSVSAGVNKQMASMLLSKLINPSYEFLSQPSQMEEYKILLKLVAQRYTQDMSRIELKSQDARALLQTQDVEGAYHSFVEALAQCQFHQLDQYLSVTGALSEVNLAYLYRQEGAPVRPSASSTSSIKVKAATTNRSKQRQSPTASSASASPAQSASAPEQAAEPPQKVNYSLVDQYCRRAEELISKSCYLEAIRELKEVVEGPNPIDPNNSKVYTLLGDIYKTHMKQPVMAKPYYTRALKADPNNVQIKKKLSELPSSQPKSKASKAAKSTANDKKKPGFFNFLSRKK
ncbi:MAG: DnaJ domain-containing protein [Cyanobacteria bacterium P01_F01_bin.42]